MRPTASTFVWVFMYVLTLTTMLGWLYMQRSTDEDRISRMIDQLTREEGKYKSAAAEFDRMIDDLNEEIDSLGQQIKASKSDVQQLRDQKNDLEGQKTTLQQQMQQTQLDLSLCDQNTASLRSQVSNMGRDVRLAMAAREKDRDARTRLTVELKEKEREIDLLQNGLDACVHNKTMLLHKLSRLTHNATRSCVGKTTLSQNSSESINIVNGTLHQSRNDTLAVKDREHDQDESDHDGHAGDDDVLVDLDKDNDLDLDDDDHEGDDDDIVNSQSRDAVLQAVMDGRLFDYATKVENKRPSWDSQFVSFTKPKNGTKMCLVVPLLIPDDGGHTQIQDDALEKLLQLKSLNATDAKEIADFFQIVVVHDVILPLQRMQSLQANISIPVEFIKADWAGNLKTHSYEKENEILLSHLFSPWLTYSGLVEKCSYLYLDDTHGEESPSEYLSLIPEIHQNLISNKILIAYGHIHEIRQKNLLTLVSRFSSWANATPTHMQRGNITDPYTTTMVPSFAGHLVIQTDFLLSSQVQAFTQFVEVSKGTAYFEWSTYSIAWIASSLFAADESTVPLIDICI
eukprot:TRINITY_DN7031_c0_g1_i1.p1 TRINITY_DN7031_c0_g1~~TRINITY_DN7031_c0_g1_i1.p1  ORF type:complete len:570 (-),score=122.77 TRINITY_DN7031_c0_g1_i1:183-1892(-)